MRTVQQIADATRVNGARLPAPRYVSREGPRLALAVASMRNHTTDEGWQLMDGLRKGGGYKLAGFGSNVDWSQRHVLTLLYDHRPSTLLVQDKREWMGRTAGAGFDRNEQFLSTELLAGQTEVFKGYVLKDAHSDQPLHEGCARDVGVHFWVVYYHPTIVAAQAPFARPEHMIRTYHSVDADTVPAYCGTGRRDAALLSGAVSGAYPLRQRLVKAHLSGSLPSVDYLKHPGYARTRCFTKDYLWTLSQYKVAICTASRFGYAVRKIVEATAAGCRVITDLPVDDALPHIDGNLTRVDVGISNRELSELIFGLSKTYNPVHQALFSERAREHYDYQALGARLGRDIEELRCAYRS